MTCGQLKREPLLNACPQICGNGLKLVYKVDQHLNCDTFIYQLIKYFVVFYIQILTIFLSY